MTWSADRPQPYPKPRAPATGRYRYTRWRWRIAVGVFDAVGAVLMAVWRLVYPLRPWPEPRAILVVQLDHLGDALLSSPIFPRLRRAFPQARIDVLASPSNRAVFEADPLVDRVHCAERTWFERTPGRRALLSAVWTLGRSLRLGEYDLGVDVRGDILSVLVLTLAGIPRRVGWAMGGGGFLLTDVARWIPGRHEVRSRLALLALVEQQNEPNAGVDLEPARIRVQPTDRDVVRVARLLRRAWPEPEARARRLRSRVPAARRAAVIRQNEPNGSRRDPADGPQSASSLERNEPTTPPGWHHQWAERSQPTESWDDLPDGLHAGRFGDARPLLAVHLGAGASAKRWPERHWRSLVGRFLDDGWRVIAVGGLDDSVLARRLADHPAYRDWTGRLSLTESAALLARADLFIGSDSGPAHLAASSSTPSVILFSGTNRPEQWRPWSRLALVLRHRVPCRPCHAKVCPLADHPCMTGLTPDRVYRAARRWWTRLHQPANLSTRRVAAVPQSGTNPPARLADWCD